MDAAGLDIVDFVDVGIEVSRAQGATGTQASEAGAATVLAGMWCWYCATL
jgi:hypothetical protein